MKNKIILYSKILKYAGENFSPRKDLIVKFKSYSDEEISYAIKKLDEMGFVSAIDLSDSVETEFRINDITSDGWELIEKLKSISEKELINNFQSLQDVFYSRKIENSLHSSYSRHNKRTLLLTIIGGLIVAAISVFVFTPLKESIIDSEIQIQNEDIPFVKNIDTSGTEQKSKILQNPPDTNTVICILQSDRTQDFFNSDLYITLSSTLPYANSQFELKLSRDGISRITSKKLSIGDKVKYFRYEIIPIESVPNLSTYDIKLKIVRK